MGERHRTHGRDEKFHRIFVRKLRGRDHPNKNQRIILKEILKKWGVHWIHVVQQRV
jgi:hypothetical protein